MYRALKNNRARYEDQMLSKLKEVLPNDVKLTLLTDRGFADQKFFNFLENELKFNFIIRFKKGTELTNSKGETKKAGEWLEKKWSSKIHEKCNHYK